MKIKAHEAIEFGDAKPAFTPGPWYVAQNHPGRSNTPRLYVRNGDAGTIAVAQLCRKPLAERHANAHLIAAAPELYAAARLTLDLLNELTTDRFQVGDDKPARDALEAALAKVTS